MRHLSTAVSIVVALLGVTPALAGEKSPTLNQELKAGEKPEKFKLIHVADAVDLQKKGKVYFLDANTPSFREKNGIVPGAHPLSSANNYDMKELPAAKSATLVFYCANTH